MACLTSSYKRLRGTFKETNLSMACYLLIQLGNSAHHISRTVQLVMRRKINNFQEALEMLGTLCVE